MGLRLGGLVPLVLTLALGMPACGSGSEPAGMRRDPEDVEALWAKAEPAVRTAAPDANWMRVRSPILPSEWPPTRRTTWARYHFAAGAERQLLDGVRVCSPFAVEHLRSDGRTARVEEMPGPPAVTTQGVRPMSGALDGPDPRVVERAALALTALPDEGSDEERLLHEHYRQWMRGHGVTVALLRPRHESFFAWLEQERRPGDS